MDTKQSRDASHETGLSPHTDINFIADERGVAGRASPDGRDVSIALFWSRPFTMAPKHTVVSMPELSYFPLSVSSV
jgi:hypothetical protein